MYERYWKANGYKNLDIVSKETGQVIGKKRPLSFYVKGEKKPKASGLLSPRRWLLAKPSSLGLGRPWLVILPPSRAGGGRCSVKPASRSLLRSRRQATRAFAQATCLNSQLGMGEPEYSPTRTRPNEINPTFHHFDVSTWITSPRY
ncbi:unnamed protein product [Arabis nemorensis]|uniref:Uncharacterized protein n=1 Tax=Arabis nemorensis TaxID=586526 RepID=A0A565CN99_9BRAS|nr:unnamed protein product [Arabis nemorensis]